MGDVERTEDGHHVVIDGRRWRATDPAIPDTLAAELRSELMAARRAVRSDGDAARPRVRDAKIALGERGEPWWEATDEGRRHRLEAAIRTLLRHRSPDRTICPSDVARVVGGEQWRPLVPVAREVAADLHAAGQVEIRQKGNRVDPGTACGPVRIGRGPSWPG